MLGIVAALPMEATAFSGRHQLPGSVLDVSEDVMLRQCGLGRERAEAAARTLVERGARALVSWGLAGGLDAVCRAGDLLMPRHIVSGSGGRVATDDAWRRRLLSAAGSRLRVHDGDQLASDLTVVDAEAKQGWRGRGVLGVDMESGGIAAVAASAGLPVLVVRSVSDPVDLEIPGCAVAGVRPDGTTDLRAVLAGVARRPRDLAGLLRLWRNSAAALGTLRTVARLTERRLAFGPTS